MIYVLCSVVFLLFDVKCSVECFVAAVAKALYVLYCFVLYIQYQLSGLTGLSIFFPLLCRWTGRRAQIANCLEWSSDRRVQHNFHMLVQLLVQLYILLVLAGPHIQWEHAHLDAGWTAPIGGAAVHREKKYRRLQHHHERYFEY